MNNLLELAARVEAAEGADRELDAEIAVAVGWQGVDLAIGSTVFPGGYLAPAYTASLDAAKALASDPAYEKFGGAMGLLREAMNRLHQAGNGIEALPRFWTAAALRARAASQGEG